MMKETVKVKIACRYADGGFIKYSAGSSFNLLGELISNAITAAYVAPGQNSLRIAAEVALATFHDVWEYLPDDIEAEGQALCNAAYNYISALNSYNAKPPKESNQSEEE